MKAARYAEGLKPEFVRFVCDELPFTSFRQAVQFYDLIVPHLDDKSLAFLGANDRFFLLTGLCKRSDALNEWLYDRCREVEARPDGHIDLWARFHYKSTIITFAGAIQEIINDPEIKIGIFSVTADIAKKFLRQIKEELERNEDLRRIYHDVFWQNPEKESPSWSTDGIVVKRKSNPREATVEAYGLLSGMPTSRHYDLRIYDDLVTERSVTETDTDQRAKTLERWELSLNLGTHLSNRQWVIGTRYSFGDLYGIIIDRKSVIERRYPATHDGTINGRPVFLTAKRWAEVKNDQRGTLAAQMLQNPLAGKENTFMMEWLRPYRVRPAILHVYIMGDPSGGKHKKSDRTAIMVVGIDPNMNYYLLDGYCHRMGLTQRKEKLFELEEKWAKMAGIYSVDIGWEKYGMQTDQEYFEQEMMKPGARSFAIREINWVNEGPQAKTARIGRIEPLFRNSKFWMPPYVHMPKLGKCTWKVVQDVEKVVDAAGNVLVDRATGKEMITPIEGSARVQYSPYRGPSSEERDAAREHERYRVMEPLRRRDEDGNVYDLTRVFFEEYRLHPFGPRDDALDATSRVWDMEPVAPVPHESVDESKLPSYPD